MKYNHICDRISYNENIIFLCYKHTLASLNLIHVLITLLRDFDGEFQKKSWHMLYVTKIIVVLYFLFIWLNEDAIISLSSQINTDVWKKKLFEET